MSDQAPASSPDASHQKADFDAKVLRGAGVNVLGMIANSTTPFVMLVAMRLFGPTTVGAYVVAASLVRMLESSVGSGYTEGIVMYGGRYSHRMTEEHQDRLYQGLANAVVVTTLLSLTALGLAWVPGLLASFVPSADVVVAVRLTLIALPFAVFRELVIAMTRARLIMRYNLILDNIILPLCALAFVSVGGATLPTLEVLCGAIVLSRIVTAGAAAWCLGHVFSLQRFWAAMRHFRFDRELTAFSLPHNLNLTFGQFAGGGDVLLLSVYGVPTEQVAFYGIASQFVRDLRTVRRSFGAILSPLVARMHAEGRVEAVAHHLVASSRWSLMLAIPAAVALAAMMSDILKLYHPSFAEPTWFVLVLTARTLVGAAIGLSGNVLMMTGHSRHNLVNSIVSAGLTFAFAALLIPQLGLLGAAIATATAEITSSVLALVQIRYLERVRPPLGGLTKPIVAGLASGALLVATWILLDASASLALRLALVAGAVVTFAGGLFALGIDEDDRLAVVVAITGKGKDRLRQSREDDAAPPPAAGAGSRAELPTGENDAADSASALADSRSTEAG